jgi:hypothetical protein
MALSKALVALGLAVVVRGSVRDQLGFPVLSWNPSGPEVNAHLLISADLRQSWSRIDAFEGSGYRRHLIPARRDGELLIANVYVGVPRNPGWNEKTKKPWSDEVKV